MLRARFRGQQEQIVALAHQIEVMARQKVLKDLGDYLKPLRPSEAGGAEAVGALLDRKIVKQARAESREKNKKGS